MRGDGESTPAALMSSAPSAPSRSVPAVVWIVALAFAAGTAVWSWWRWWTYQYTTFDLAFYIQTVWLALRGEWYVSVLDVPLLGNHAEPIVYLFAPLYAVCPHPMIFVAVQSISLALSAIFAWHIAIQASLSRRAAAVFALLILVTPATGFAAIHEFHPEALAIPFILGMAAARGANRWGWYCLSTLLLLACKENLTLLVIAWCFVFAVIDRKRGSRWQLLWNVIPGVIAITWFVAYTKWVSPALNGGRIDYLRLYSHLGSSGPAIIQGFFLRPNTVIAMLFRSLREGDLVWATVFPLLGLPFFRLRWWLIAAPILGQHLLSWRVSEWTIRFHYAAPLVPLMWLAALEIAAKFKSTERIAWGALFVSMGFQIWRGPAAKFYEDCAHAPDFLWQQRWMSPALDRLAKNHDISVTAAMPLISHLAERRDLQALSHVTTGLTTLGEDTYQWRTTDVFAIDFKELSSPVSRIQGAYHPTMRTTDGRIIPSSDQLIRAALANHNWQTYRRNELGVFQKAPLTPNNPGSGVTNDKGELSDVHLDQATASISWKTNYEPHPYARNTWAKLLLVDPANHFESIPYGPLNLGSPRGNSTESWKFEIPPSFKDSKSLRAVLLLYPAASGLDDQEPPWDWHGVIKEIDLGAIVPGRK